MTWKTDLPELASTPPQCASSVHLNVVAQFVPGSYPSLHLPIDAIS
jgi:hypothetical protein